MSGSYVKHHDILPPDLFHKKREEMHQEVINLKKKRRVYVGPFVAALFESRLTILWQIQEMIRIEKSWPQGVQDELDAYNPLLPQGKECVATVMIEIDDPTQRKEWLQKLIGFEKHISLHINDEIVRGHSLGLTEDQQSAFKTTTVHFMKFPLNTTQIKFLLNDQEKTVKLVIDHPSYPHETLLSPETLQSLQEDFPL